MRTDARRAIVITGAASGIGAATARRFAADGDLVHCLDRDGAGARAVAAAITAAGRVARAVEMDVTDEAAWERLLDEVSDDAARLATVVHCAGISAASPLAETSLAEWRRVLAVNLDGAFLATRFGLCALSEAGGAIVLVGSASGIRAAPGAAAYSTSKAGLTMLARAAAKEARAAGLAIRVNVVSPAGVKTPLWRSMPFFREMVDRLGSEEAAFAEMARAAPGSEFSAPDDVAAAIRFLASDEARHVTGVELPLDDGFTL